MSEIVNTVETPKPGTKQYLEAQLAAAQAELEALKAEKEAQKSQEGEAAVPCEAPQDEKVEISVDRGYANDEPNLLISVNGVNYLLPKGKTSRVPKFVAEEYYRAKRAQMALDDKQAQMLEVAK